MKTLGNILWFVFAGLWLALGYALAGLVLCITIIGIPFGVQAFKLAAFTLWPFGKTVVASPEGGCLEVGANVVWLVLVGWELFLAHLAAGVLLCITIIGHCGPSAGRSCPSTRCRPTPSSPIPCPHRGSARLESGPIV